MFNHEVSDDDDDVPFFIMLLPAIVVVVAAYDVANVVVAVALQMHKITHFLCLYGANC